MTFGTERHPFGDRYARPVITWSLLPEDRQSAVGAARRPQHERVMECYDPLKPPPFTGTYFGRVYRTRRGRVIPGVFVNARDWVHKYPVFCAHLGIRGYVRKRVVVPCARSFLDSRHPPLEPDPSKEMG